MVTTSLIYCAICAAISSAGLPEARTAQVEANSAGLAYCLNCEALFSVGLGMTYCWLEVLKMRERRMRPQGVLRKDSFNRQPLSQPRDPRDHCLRQHHWQQPTQKLAFFQLFSLNSHHYYPKASFPKLGILWLLKPARRVTGSPQTAEAGRHVGLKAATSAQPQHSRSHGVLLLSKEKVEM